MNVSFSTDFCTNVIVFSDTELNIYKHLKLEINIKFRKFRRIYRRPHRHLSAPSENFVVGTEATRGGPCPHGPLSATTMGELCIITVDMVTLILASRTEVDSFNVEIRWLHKDPVFRGVLHLIITSESLTFKRFFLGAKDMQVTWEGTYQSCKEDLAGLPIEIF